MRFEHVGSVSAVGGNFADIEGFIPQPGRIVRRGVVNELLAWARGGDIEQFHRLLRGWVFVVVVHDEQSGQLRRLPQELQVRLEGLSGKQCQRFHLSGMPARRLYGIVDSEYAGSSHADDIALDGWL